MRANSGRNAPGLESYWMPFTANRQFKADPRMIVAADGMYYTAADGHRVLDGTAGLWCVNAGHGRTRIAQAVERQLATLDFAPSFQMGHPVAFDFAERLAAIAPGGPDAPLDRIFFTGSGSESVDTALKIALAYQRAVGQGSRLSGSERGAAGGRPGRGGRRAGLPRPSAGAAWRPARAEPEDDGIGGAVVPVVPPRRRV